MAMLSRGKTSDVRMLNRALATSSSRRSRLVLLLDARPTATTDSSDSVAMLSSFRKYLIRKALALRMASVQVPMGQSCDEGMDELV